MAQVVGSLIDHKTPTLHPDRVAAVEVGVKVSTVAHALMMPTLEISVFVKYDLQKNYFRSAVPILHKHNFQCTFPVITFNELTFPIVILVGARLMVNRSSLRRPPFILSSRVMAQQKVLSSK